MAGGQVDRFIPVFQHHRTPTLAMSSSTMETPTPRKSSLPISSHTATTNRQGIPTPLTVAHRGYKGKYPENSLAAFMGAVEAGSHGIETDLRLSRDGVVVLAHVCLLLRLTNGVLRISSGSDAKTVLQRQETSERM